MATEVMDNDHLQIYAPTPPPPATPNHPPLLLGVWRAQKERESKTKYAGFNEPLQAI